MHMVVREIIMIGVNMEQQELYMKIVAIDEE